jgi:N-acetyl-beta-hexosaminidase
MRHTRILITLALAVIAAFQANAGISIIPEPASIVEKGGEYALPSSLTISYSDKSLAPAASYLKDILAPATGYDISVRKGSKGDIRLVLAKQSSEKEDYTLSSSASGIVINASSYKGIIHGIATLRQLLPYQIEYTSILHGVNWAVPCVEISDAPLYEWRGLMLDPVRHFYSVEETKKFLDIMALYKFSKFHWHLIDSQAWRIEIKKYPLLTEKGAWRDPLTCNIDVACEETAVRDNNPSMALPLEHIRMVDGKRIYGGFYTQDDIREIVEYAMVRGIDVVPEIDMPGHNWMATQCYPWLSCGHDGTDPLCLGSDEVMQWAKDVFKEVFDLFPYNFAEIGGDEVSRNKWASCPLCQARIEKEHLGGLEELQSWFTREMEKYFNANGRRLIGWDEILEGGVSPTATVNWWQGYHADVVQRSTAGGNEVICCPTTFCYFDYGQNDDTMRTLYEGDVVPTDLSEAQAKLVKGMQGNIWGEYIPSFDRMSYMTFPRALALAEKAWSPASRQSWDSYCARLGSHLSRLNVLGIKYRPVK